MNSARPQSGAAPLVPSATIRFVRLVAGLVLLPGSGIAAQNPLMRPADAVEARYAASQPVVGYTIHLDAGDTTGFDVTLRVRNAADTFRLAMPRHPEYDERYWRYVANVRVESPRGTPTVMRLDSALWRVTTPAGEAVIRYRIEVPAPPPPPNRGAWRPFISSLGALVGGPYGVMYVVGAELAPSHVRIEVPAGWGIATGLEPTSDPGVFFAPSVMILNDSPLLLGELRDWRFAVGGVPHRVAYLPIANATPFDTAALVDRLRRLTSQAITLFGRAPYREYTFLMQDGSFGALEHLNSVTIGMPSADLARNPDGSLLGIAHEYFHIWNIMRIRPAEYPAVTWQAFPPSSGLWWSEGLTMFYADLLLRRAGVPLRDSTRINHLESLIARYLSEPGDSRVSPERVSRVAYGGSPDALGDYQASTHLQGELLGAMLDFKVRAATRGRRTIDDVMRAMMKRYGGTVGFRSGDIAVVVEQVCACDTKEFFDTYVRGAAPIDFNRFLALVGLRVDVTRTPAFDEHAQPVPNRRIYVFNRPGDSTGRLLLSSPESEWGRAGFHSGDAIVSMNGTKVPDFATFRQLVSHWQVGDSIRVVVSRPDGSYARTVVIAQAQAVTARITELPGATPAQRTLRTAWEMGTR